MMNSSLVGTMVMLCTALLWPLARKGLTKQARLLHRELQSIRSTWSHQLFWIFGTYWLKVIWLKLFVLTVLAKLSDPSWPLQWRQRRWQWRPWKVRRPWPRERFWVSWPLLLRWRSQTSPKSWTHWLRSAPRRWRSLASSFSRACVWSRLARRQLPKVALGWCLGKRWRSNHSQRRLSWRHFLLLNWRVKSEAILNVDRLCWAPHASGTLGVWSTTSISEAQPYVH